MHGFSRFGVFACVMVLSSAALAEGTMAPADPAAPVAGSAAPVAPEAVGLDWQAVITAQIEALRKHDAPAALSFAAAAFQQGFPDPTDFYMTVVASGYAPIIQSRSHSFGLYKLIKPDLVVQDVKLTGNDQSLYEALYQLTKEAGGWRVSGVQLKKTQGIGV